MCPFDPPNPTTFAALVNLLRDGDLALDTARDDLRDIRHATSLVASLQANYSNLQHCHSCGRDAPLASYVQYVIRYLEAVGVRGWLWSLEEHLNRVEQDTDKVEQALAEVTRLKQVEIDLREKIERLEEQFVTATRLTAQLEDRSAEKGSDQATDRLRDIVERLESLVCFRQMGTGKLDEINSAGPSSTLHAHRNLDEGETRDGSNTSSVQGHIHTVELQTLSLPFSETSEVVDDGRSGLSSPAPSVAYAALIKDLENLPSLETTAMNEQRVDVEDLKRMEENITNGSDELKEILAQHATSTLHDTSKTEDHKEEQSHLRGGASSSTSEDRERRFHAAFDAGARFAETPDLSHDGFQSACFEYIRMLQMHTKCQECSIKRLQLAITDMEDTFKWQDNVLDELHHRAEFWKEEAMKAKEDAIAARHEVNAARCETEETNAQMEEIKNQIRAFYGQLDMKLEETERDDESESSSRSSLPSMRGGAGCTGDTVDLTSTLGGKETSPVDIDASAFYYFPSVSTMVLLTAPLRSFQWRQGTTLVQARGILQYHHDNGMKMSPYLNHIREIMALREHMGIALPDASDNSQILVSLPVIENITADGRSAGGNTARWESRFGPDEYEILLREQLGVSVRLDDGVRGRSPPSTGEVDEAHSDANDLSTPHESSCQCQEPGGSYSSCVRGGMQNPYATPLPNLRGGGDTLRTPLHTTPPPNEIPSSVLYPLAQESRPTLSRGSSKSVVPECFEHFHPARMPEERMWNVDQYPRAEGSGSGYTESELERSANYDYELEVGGQSDTEPSLGRSKFQANSDREQALENAELEKWRHRKGEGCESWLDESALDPKRKTCTFCDLPWATGSDSQWEFAARVQRCYPGVLPPVDTRRRSSPMTVVQTITKPSCEEGPRAHLGSLPSGILEQVVRLGVEDRQETEKQWVPESVSGRSQATGQPKIKDRAEEYDGTWRDV